MSEPKLLTLAKVGRYSDPYPYLCRREWIGEQVRQEKAAQSAAKGRGETEERLGKVDAKTPAAPPPSPRVGESDAA